MLCKGRKEIELPRRERDIFAAGRYKLTAAGVKPPALKANDLIVATRRDSSLRLRQPRTSPTQYAFDPGHHFAKVKGLGDIVVSANLQPDNAVEHVVAPCQHDDPNI